MSAVEILLLILSCTLFVLLILQGGKPVYSRYDSDTSSSTLKAPPITLLQRPFDQIIIGSEMMEIVKEYELNRLSDAILMAYGKKEYAHSTYKIIENIRKVGKNEYILELSAQGKKVLDRGDAELVINTKNRMLPMIRDAKTKGLTELITITKNGPRQIAMVGSIVTNACHIVSAADVANKVKVMDRKIDRLVKSHKISQIAILETAYRTVQEVAFSKTITDLDRYRLVDCHKDLLKLRSTWKQEVLHDFQEIDDPSKSLLNKIKSSPFEAIKKRIENVQNDIAMYDLALNLDIIINGFVETHLQIAHDIQGINDIKSEMVSKIKFLEKREKIEEEAKVYINVLENLEQKYLSFQED